MAEAVSLRLRADSSRSASANASKHARRVLRCSAAVRCGLSDAIVLDSTPRGRGATGRGTVHGRQFVVVVQPDARVR